VKLTSIVDSNLRTSTAEFLRAPPVAPHFVGSRRKLSNAGTEASVEEFGKRAIPNQLELGHFDMIFANERLNLARAQARVLIKSVKPVIDWLRLDPLCKRTLRLALVVGLVIIHPLLDQHPTLVIPDR